MTAIAKPTSEFAFREPTDVTVKKVNLHKVFHGKEYAQGVEIDMALTLQNTALDVIIPGLREALYWNPNASPNQETLDGMGRALPNLRFPRLNNRRYSLGDKKNDKLAGYELLIQYGLGDDVSNLLFDCCRVCKIVIETMEGGSIGVEFQVQYNGDRLDKDACGKLALLEKDLITITLIPPVVSQQPDSEEDDEDMDNPFPFDGEEEGEPTAEDLFIEAASEPSDEQQEAANLESDER